MIRNKVVMHAFDRLAAAIAGEVFTDGVRRCLLATDASIFQKMPAAVVYPRSTADVRAVVRCAVRHRLGIHPRGAGSGLCGSAVGDGIVVDFSKHMNRLLHLDLARGVFECEPGYRFGELSAVLKGTGWFFPPDPSSGEYATFGGMCATNASGAHSVKYGNVADYLLDAQVVWADGACTLLSELADMPIPALPAHLTRLAGMYLRHADRIEASYPAIRCNVAGYNLRGLVRHDRLHLHRLLCGAEGTLGLITRLRFALRERPGADTLVVAFFDDIVKAAKAAQQAIALSPSGIEIMDKSLLRIARDTDDTLRHAIPTGIDNVLLIEFDGPSAAACTPPAEVLMDRLRAAELTRRAHLAVSADEKERFWALRKAAVPTLYTLKGRRKVLALVEDAAVPVDGLVPYFQGVYAIFNRFQVPFVLYGHIAKGLMHTRPLLDLKDPADVALLRPIADAIFELVEGLNGTVSGEHGDGRLRSAYIRRKYPDIFPLFVRTKQLLDPGSIFNPDIKVSDDPAQMTRDLRFGPHYRARAIAGPRLLWHGTFADEVEQCHGCSQCTTVTTATRMCPVYKATRDEAASPKAKANVLRALISGAVADKTLYDAGVQQVMAQCVNCGSCYRECPSHVNIPKLALEAKSQYARRFGVRLPERLTASVELAAKASHRAMPLIAPLMERPVTRRMMARLVGLAPEREMVRFHRHPLYSRLPRNLPGAGPRVLYYTGCYAAFIRPELGQAAVRVMQRMGFRIHLPRQYCCGLPQLSRGLAAAARRMVRRNLSAWESLLDQVDYIAVTCSSCGYALMQDWADLAGGKTVARIQAKTIHVSHLINRCVDRLPPLALPMHLAYHQPCHLRIQPEPDSSIRLLSLIEGMRLDNLPSRCCGIAGSWGMLAANYNLSKAIGTPLVESLCASGAEAGATDCPTCQIQLTHLGRHPIRHPVEIVWQAMHSGAASRRPRDAEASAPGGHR